jgi:hypothetical protein
MISNLLENSSMCFNVVESMFSSDTNKVQQTNMDNQFLPSQAKHHIISISKAEEGVVMRDL